MTDPIKQSKSDFENIIKVIGSNSAVGIDAQLTHAIIISYLQQLTARLEKIELALAKKI